MFLDSIFNVECSANGISPTTTTATTITTPSIIPAFFLWVCLGILAQVFHEQAGQSWGSTEGNRNLEFFQGTGNAYSTNITVIYTDRLPVLVLTHGSTGLMSFRWTMHAYIAAHVKHQSYSLLLGRDSNRG